MNHEVWAALLLLAGIAMFIIGLNMMIRANSRELMGWENETRATRLMFFGLPIFGVGATIIVFSPMFLYRF